MDPAHDQMVDYAVETLLHETTGHGLDSRYLSPRLPYLMRNHHAITTESHAMLMEDIVQEPAWWESVVKLPSAKAQAVAAQAQAYTKLQKLRGLRWMVSLIQFERELYRNPGQNLTRLWWQLQKQYLGEEPGDQAKLPVYAGIPHFFSHPVYYQNYFLADLARSQKLETIQTRYGSLLTPEAGDYLKTYRKVGQRYDWDDLVERMTGEPLGVKAIQRELSGLTLPDAPAS
jgi:peptidyl-dipeptidase A